VTAIDDALTTATDTRAVLLSRGAIAETGRLFTDVFGDATALVVADESTWRVAGQAVVDSLVSAGVTCLEPYVFPGKPTLYADYGNVSMLRDHAAATDAVIVVVGSGTLNDIAKLASGELDRPYAVVATAASMDGYAAFGASITRDGFKITRTCPAPALIVASLDVMATAPARLTATGYGDLVEKLPAGADWVVADELGIEPIDTDVWNLVQPPLRHALADPAGCAAGDVGAISALAEGLLLSGLAMQALQSSRPASGAGHNFSHQWEMEKHGFDWEPPLTHGIKVGLGTIASCALYEAALLLDVSGVDPEACAAAWLTPEQDVARVTALQPQPAIREPAIAQSRLKYVPAGEAADRIRAIKAAWPAIIERVRPLLLGPADVAERLHKVGSAYHPAQIGISQDRLRRTYFQAQTIRSRYTMFDALYELGLLDTVVDALFAPGGYWSDWPHD
jgi:glycerol-1-phosphate dehydrogenase [NAD(P)+]